MGVSTFVAPDFNGGFAAVTLTVGLDAGDEVSKQQQNETANTIAVSEETKIVIPPKTSELQSHATEDWQCRVKVHS